VGASSFDGRRSPRGEADEEMGPKYTFFRKYFDIGDEEIFLFFAHGSRLVADLILKNSVFHLFIEAKIKAKLATDVICNER